MVELFANSGDPDQTPRSAASDLGLHRLPNTRLWVSSLQCVYFRFFINETAYLAVNVELNNSILYVLWCVGFVTFLIFKVKRIRIII